MSHSSGSPMAVQAMQVARPAQLPMGACTFIGRAETLAQARGLIGRNAAVRLPLLVSGPVGVGKEAFALRLAEDVGGDFPDGQLYADLGECATDGQCADGIVWGFLQALGGPAASVPGDPMQRIGLYRSLLAQRRVFVLLSNVHDESQVRPLLGQTTNSLVVVTSRARLLGLEAVHRIQLDMFTRRESMTLLGVLAGVQRVQAELAAVNAIAETCDDLPLAVSIVGRKLAAKSQWAIAYTADRLGDRNRLLDGLCVGDVSVRERFASAYRLLSPAGRLALHQIGLDDTLSVATGELAAALDVSVHAADELLDSLVDAGLLGRGGSSGRYRVTTLVGVFAAEARRGARPAPYRTVGF